MDKHIKGIEGMHNLNKKKSSFNQLTTIYDCKNPLIKYTMIKL